ncbi:MAG: phosphodiester glycosidase family protein [Planctomycetota bacterium]|nr:phosphodiester glycosidase family protein [Planctomycetota bacterium]
MPPETRPRTWIDACTTYGQSHGVSAEVLGALDAFSSAHPRGGPPRPAERAWDDDFEALEAQWPEQLDVSALKILLSPEADGRQPGVFARRTAVTEGILRDLGSPAARILRVGLRVRLEGISAAPPPRLKRVRALADFYYSYAARLLHPQWTAEPHHLEELVAAATWRDVAAGLEYSMLDGLAGGMPVHVNVLRIDPKRVAIRVRDLTSLTSRGQSFAEAAGPEVRAGVSGGFFLYSESDIELPSHRHDPVGLLLQRGIVRAPPVFNRAALLAGEGAAEVRRVALGDVDIAVDGRPLPPASFVNRADAEVGPDAPSFSVVGESVLAVGSSLPVPLNGFVAVPDAGLTPAMRAGARVSYEPPRMTGGGTASDGVAGGPLLLHDGQPALDMRAEDFWGSAPPITFSQDETGDRNLLARMLAGIDADGRLLVAAVDGRNAERALGMTLSDAGRLMALLGCRTAMNLDGGSSKRMLVDGAIVDLPNTEIVAGESAVVRVRPVHSAVLFEPRA